MKYLGGQIFEEDCMTAMSRLDDASVDMILCDLPYGTTQNKWDSVIQLDELWKQYKRIIKPKGVIALTSQGIFTARLIISNESWFRYKFVWVKSKSTNFLNARKQPLRQHEDICIFYKKPPVYNPQKTTGHVRKVSKAEHKVGCKNTTDYGEHGLTTYDSTERYPRSVWKFAKDVQKSALHPTQKPLALIEELIKTYTNEGDLVLDSCIGSGTTGLACKNLNRRFIGIEKDEKYFEIAKERIGI